MLYDRLLVRIIDNTQKTSGGLYIPDIARDGSPWRSGEVVAVGHGRVNANGDVIPLKVKAGDCIWFFRNPGGGEQLIVPDDDGTDLLCIREPHVLAILDQKALPRGTGLIGTDGNEVVVTGSVQ